MLELVTHWVLIRSVALVVGVLAGAYLAGVFLNTLIIKKLQHRAYNTNWKWGEVLLSSLRRILPLWTMALGLYISVGFLELSEHILQLVREGLFVFTILSISSFFASIASQAVVLYSIHRDDARAVTTLTQNIVRAVIFLIGALIILHRLGVSIAPMLTAVGVGGLAVALGLQETLSNVFAGIHITWAEQVRLGDYIKLSTGEEGYVVDITWRSTRIKTLQDNLVTVPNSKLAQSITINYHMPSQDLWYSVTLNIALDADLEKVEKVTFDVAQETMRTVEGCVKLATPIVRFTAFQEWSIGLSVSLRLEEFAYQYPVRHEFIKRLQRRFLAENIHIPYPTRHVNSYKVEN